MNHHNEIDAAAAILLNHVSGPEVKKAEQNCQDCKKKALVEISSRENEGPMRAFCMECAMAFLAEEMSAIYA